MALVLITGGAGFIGSHLVEELLRRGETVRVLDSLATGSLQNLRFAVGQVSLPSDRRQTVYGSQLELIIGDVRDPALVRKAMRGVENVFHLAAITSVAQSIRQPSEVNSVNVDGTLNVLQAAQSQGVRRVIYASSSAVYGNSDVLPRSEDTRPTPVSPYGAAKLAGEAYCQAFWSCYGLETVTLRYFNVYGPRQSATSDYTSVIPTFILAMLQNQAPVIHGDGKQTRDFVSVDDVVDASIAAAASHLAPGRCFNVASGEMHSVFDLFESLSEILETNLAPDFSPAQPGDVRESLGNIELARELLNYIPRTPFHQGLAHTVEFFSHVVAQERGGRIRARAES
ncbi:MAG TPA: NAD-dependent epimerase/dehydratase family protein [Methylomirabilota bacterium]|nr:NAD-dependent epimerase/dehydratase family protein [Methylomirabilota bacterium]